jgi:serine/threonine protein kinase
MGLSSPLPERFAYDPDELISEVLAEACGHLGCDPRRKDLDLFIEIKQRHYFLAPDQRLSSVNPLPDDSILRVLLPGEMPPVYCPPSWAPLMRLFHLYVDRRLPEGQFLGAGATSSVHRFTDRDHGYVAFKNFNTTHIATSRDLVMRELHIMIAASHPAIVRVYWVVSERRADATPFTGIVMEYCENGALPAAFKAKRPGPTEKMIVMLGTADAMAYLHGRRICHRDLKPGNILLDEAFRPTVSDFGFSKRVGLPGASHMISYPYGTVAFMAPEAALGQPDYQVFRADVYSFAMTAYNIVADQEPFPGLGPVQFMMKIQNKDRPPLDDLDIPRDLRGLIQRG